MGFDIKKLMNAATNAEVQERELEGFKAIRLDYREIVVTNDNKYSMNEIEKMAAGIEMAGGLLQPLILGRVNGEYWLAGGHRRYAGTDVLVKEGKEEYALVDCRYKDMTETEFRLYILIGNTFNRHYTEYDKMMEAEEWKNVLKQALKEKLLVLERGERVRDYVAKIMGTSAAVIGDYGRRNKNAVPEIKEQFKDGSIGVTAAAAVSQLPEGEQKEIAEKARAGEDIKAIKIQKMVAEKKEEKEKRSIEEQKKEQVSDTDTNAEEKANAEKLHVLKMLEKYYVFMSEEEKEILKSILEDCKRRKREYGLDDVGSTVS